MKTLVGKATFLDLRYEEAYQDMKTLNKFIRDEINLLKYKHPMGIPLDKVCDFVSQLPPEVRTIIGGHKATEEVETLFGRCPHIERGTMGSR